MTARAGASLSPWLRRFDARRGRAPTRRGPGLAGGLALSLLLHALLVTPWLAGRRLATPPHQESLRVDILGLLGERQIERQTPPPPPAAPPPRAAVAVATGRASPLPKPAPAPVAVTPQPEPAPAPAVAPPVAEANTAPTSANEAIPAQTIRQRQANEADLLRAYLANVRKAIQGGLVYPPEARAAGAVGSPVVRFTITESGAILPGSLVLHQGCGFAALDDNALRAARAGAPFPRPPRAMDVVLAISFASSP